MKPAGPLTLDDEDEAVAEEENKIINEVCLHYGRSLFLLCGNRARSYHLLVPCAILVCGYYHGGSHALVLLLSYA